MMYVSANQKAVSLNLHRYSEVDAAVAAAEGHPLFLSELALQPKTSARRSRGKEEERVNNAAGVGKKVSDGGGGGQTAQREENAGGTNFTSDPGRVVTPGCRFP
jgi:hypothetical protein